MGVRLNANYRRPPARIMHDGVWRYWTGESGVAWLDDGACCDVGEYEANGCETAWFRFDGTPIGRIEFTMA